MKKIMPGAIAGIVATIAILSLALASPPTGTIGNAIRNLFGSSSVGIGTATPGTLLDINGTTTARQGINMAGNRILNVATPVLGTDAINKNYADTIIRSMGPAVRLWGEGRPGASVTNLAGECTSTMTGPVIKVSRSTRVATWDGAGAACPANWWVCTAQERGTRLCGSTTRNILYCNVPSTTDDLTTTVADWAWVANTATTTNSFLWGKIARTVSGGTASDQYMCNLLPVWCCSY